MGYSQRPGINFIKMFASIVRMASLHTVLAIPALEDPTLPSLDFSHAFINTDLEMEIYVEQPKRFHFGNPDDVLRLQKSLYGLKQAG